MIVKPGDIATDTWGNEFMPISVKAVIEEDGKIWLRRNEWETWELPGGRIDPGEQPEETIVREIREELGLVAEVEKLLDVYVWRKEFGNNRVIAIVTFKCGLVSREGDLELVGEAGATTFEQFTVDRALRLDDLPEVYKRALQKN